MGCPLSVVSGQLRFRRGGTDCFSCKASQFQNPFRKYDNLINPFLPGVRGEEIVQNDELSVVSGPLSVAVSARLIASLSNSAFWLLTPGSCPINFEP
jgi:hypothetical protein